MKFLCLAYGSEADWKALSKSEQESLLAQDTVLKERGDFVAPVQPQVTTLRAWDGTPITEERPFATAHLPLAGFSIVEADDLEAVIGLVAGTPCAKAKGSIEIRPIIEH